MVRLGELQTIPCDILNWGVADGKIIWALLLTTPVLWLWGDATVVLAFKGFTGKSNKIIAQT